MIDNPIHHITRMPFWDHQALLDEANEVERVEGAVHRKKYIGPCFFHQDHNYLELTRMKQNFESIYGDFGLITAGYIVGYPDDKYGWHSDVDVERSVRDMGEKYPDHDMLQRFPLHKFERGQEAKAGFNIMLKGDDPIQFQHNSLQEVYKCAILAVNENHRVVITTKRVIASLQFREATYEEVVHRVTRIDNGFLKPNFN